jgi:dipeptide transport system permease protein
MPTDPVSAGRCARPCSRSSGTISARTGRGDRPDFFVIIVVFIAVFARLIAPHLPNQQYRDAFLSRPFWQDGGSMVLPLGTDAVGRDMLSRLIYGARFSLFIGCRRGHAVVSSASSRADRRVLPRLGRHAIMRVMDVILAFPSCCWRWCWWPSSARADERDDRHRHVLQPHYVRLTRASVLSEMNGLCDRARVIGVGGCG